MDFYSQVTAIGLAKQSQVFTEGGTLDLASFKLGDSNGDYYDPSGNETALRRVVWTGQISAIRPDPANPNKVIIEAIVPADVGGFYIREVGVFDSAGDLIVIAKYPETYKPTIDTGTVSDLTIELIIEVLSADILTHVFDPSKLVATQESIDNALAQHAQDYDHAQFALRSEVPTDEDLSAATLEHEQLYNHEAYALKLELPEAGDFTFATETHELLYDHEAYALKSELDAVGSKAIASLDLGYVASEPLVPIISDVTTPNGTVITSGTHGAASDASWRAFDADRFGTRWWGAAYDVGGWVGFQHDETPFTVDRFELGVFNMRDFNLEGFDGTSWVVIQNYALPNEWGNSADPNYVWAAEERSFSVLPTNQAPYSGHRIVNRALFSPLIATLQEPMIHYLQFFGTYPDAAEKPDLLLKRGNSGELATYVPRAGEPVYDSTEKDLVVGDGITPGGNPVGSAAVSAHEQEFDHSAFLLTAPDGTFAGLTDVPTTIPGKVFKSKIDGSGYEWGEPIVTATTTNQISSITLTGTPEKDDAWRVRLGDATFEEITAYSVDDTFDGPANQLPDANLWTVDAPTVETDGGGALNMYQIGAQFSTAWMASGDFDIKFDLNFAGTIGRHNRNIKFLFTDPADPTTYASIQLRTNNSSDALYYTQTGVVQDGTPIVNTGTASGIFFNGSYSYGLNSSYLRIVRANDNFNAWFAFNNEGSPPVFAGTIALPPTTNFKLSILINDLPAGHYIGLRGVSVITTGGSILNLDGSQFGGTMPGVAAALAAKIDADPNYTATSNDNVITVAGVAVGQGFAVSGEVENGGQIHDQLMTISTITPANTFVDSTPGPNRVPLVGPSGKLDAGWLDVVPGLVRRAYDYVATEGQTDFACEYTAGDLSGVDVWLSSGKLVRGTDYIETIGSEGSSITLTAALTAGDNVEIITWTAA